MGGKLGTQIRMIIEAAAMIEGDSHDAGVMFIKGSNQYPKKFRDIINLAKALWRRRYL